LDAETDNDVKKVVAAAVEIAKKKKLLAEELNQCKYSPPPLKKGAEGDLSNKISPNPSFSKRST